MVPGRLCGAWGLVYSLQRVESGLSPETLLEMEVGRGVDQELV